MLTIGDSAAAVDGGRCNGSRDGMWGDTTRVKRRRFRDRIVAAGAIALLGSLALVPTATLAGHSVSGGGQAHSKGHHGSSSGDDNDLGHILRVARQHGAAAAPSSTDDADGRTLDCGAPNQAGGDESCHATGSRSETTDAVSPSTPAPGSALSTTGSAGGSTSASKGRAASAAAASSASRPLTGTRVVQSAHGAAPVQGVSLPGASVPISQAPATNPAAGQPPPGGPTAAPATVNPVLGPVPVLVPSIGAISHGAAVLPWNWLIGIGIAAVLLVALIVVTRRHASSGPL